MVIYIATRVRLGEEIAQRALASTYIGPATYEANQRDRLLQELQRGLVSILSGTDIKGRA
jgi:hypothetical protein